MGIMMQCGCSSNGATMGGKPVCVVHVGIDPGARKVDKTPPDLKGREAQCDYCKTTRPSDPMLPFFVYRKGAGPDGYYCGCRGWD